MAQSSAPQGHGLHESVHHSETPSRRWFGGLSFRLCLLAARPLIKTGNLAFRYRDQPFVALGDGSGAYCAVRIESPGLLRRVLASPDLALGEGYMNGEWRLEHGDLAKLLGHLLVNQARLFEHPAAQFLTSLQERLAGPHHDNGPADSRANAAHHYDMGNDLYSAFLDEGMNYSCAFFEHPGQSLRDAQLNKLRTSIERLDVGPGMSVLDIGCGWGELTRMITQSTDAGQVVGITLAEAQCRWAEEHVRRESGNRLRYGLEDYRDHATARPNFYDRVISIGMFEHVGKHRFLEYFQAIRHLLKAGGQALIHSIVRPTKGWTSPWIDRYIFPGGYIPMLGEMIAAAKQAGLSVAVEPFIHESAQYATTLRHWRQRFNAAYPSLDDAHYDERFRRMWNFYLAGSEAAFDATGFYVAQVLFRRAP